MRKTVAIMAGMALSSGMAFAAQEQDTQDYDPNRDIVTETERDRGTGMEMPRQEDSPVQSEYGTEPETQTDRDMSTDPYGTGTEEGTTGSSDRSTAGTYGDKAGKDLSQKTAEELSGKTVVTTTGEEIGQIGEVGYSATHQERVATVDVGGFLGVGERRVAIPLSELEMGEDDNLQTSLSRESIEAQEEFDEAGFTADQ